MLHSEITDFKAVGQDVFDATSKAEHGLFGTVLCKEHDAMKLGDRYAEIVLSAIWPYIKALFGEILDQYEI